MTMGNLRRPWSSMHRPLGWFGDHLGWHGRSALCVRIVKHFAQRRERIVQLTTALRLLSMGLVDDVYGMNSSETSPA